MKLGEAVARFRGQRDFHVNFIGRRRVWFLLSGLLVTISIVGILGPGLNFGIDFRGGALLEYENRAGLSAEDVRGELADLGRGEAVVQLVDEGNRINVRTESLGEQRGELLEALATQAGLRPGDINVEDVGPKWGEQISRKALQGFAIFLIVVTIYISFRFEWKMAVAAIAALGHDLTITAGVFALVGREVSPETVIAILTIMGYSLYDTVVIFDKIKENAESPTLVARETYGGAVNLSLNQVMIRSINTSLTSLLPIGALLFLGGETLKDFAFALFVGVGVGTYSSIFVAAPVLTLLKEREPRMARIRAQATRQGPRPSLRPVPEGEAEAAPAATPSSGGRGRQIQPRRQRKKKPRSKRRRR